MAAGSRQYPFNNGSGIYRITNVVSGKFYVGSAVSIYKRLASHRKRLLDGTHHNKHMLSACEKYGIAVFEFSVLEYVEDPDRLIEREQHWIDSLRAVEVGYNKRPHTSSNLGMTLSEDTRRKMSESRIGKRLVWSEEAKSNYREMRKTYRLPEESRKKMSDTKKSRPPTQAQLDARKNAGEKNRGRRHKPETIAKMVEWNTGRKMPVGTGAKISAAKKGIKRPAHAVEASARWHTGRKDSPEVVARRAESNRGKKRTPEQCERIRAGKLAAKQARMAATDLELQ